MSKNDTRRDEVLLAFLARTVHPEVAADVTEAMKQVEELNRLLAR